MRFIVGIVAAAIVGTPVVLLAEPAYADLIVGKLATAGDRYEEALPIGQPLAVKANGQARFSLDLMYYEG